MSSLALPFVFLLPLHSQTHLEFTQSYECPRLQRIIATSNNEAEISKSKAERFKLQCTAYEYEELRKSFNDFMRLFK